MAFKDINGLERANGESNSNPETLKLQIMDNVVELPNDSFVRDADMTRENMDLVLESPEGTIIIEDYFSGFESPALTAPSGASLSPQLVNSFISSGNEYANAATSSDVSPIGSVQEMNGDATITRVDGTTETLSINTPVYQGDVIETDAGSAVNIVFIDESSFAVSEETRLAIDEYVFDPASQGGVQNFSVLKGVFVYTSGLIGREDPDDVAIETPVGSIGIRGTIIAGDVDQGEITVVEGAIVLRNTAGEEMTLASQFETGKFLPDNRGIQNLGQKSANDVVEKFSVVSNVAPTLFSSINDAAAENQPQAEQPVQDAKPMEKPAEGPDMRGDKPMFDADGTTDQDGNSQVDGTVDDAGKDDGESGDGAMMDAPTDGTEKKLTDMQEGDDPAMNPMAMKIAYAMGMMDGNNPMMQGGSMQPTGVGGMETMMAMSMNTDEMLSENNDTVMEVLEDMIDESNSEMTDSDAMTQQGPQSTINDPATTYYSGDSTVNAPINLRPGANSFGVGLQQKSIAPNEFFASGEDTVWNYHFDKEFAGANIQGYQLHNSTFNDLIDLRDTHGVVDTFSFNNTNGNLTIDFSVDFSALIGTNMSHILNIRVAAVNAGGSSGFTNYNFGIFNDGATITAGIGEISGDNIIANQPGNTASTLIEIGQSNASNFSKFFFGGGNDTVTIGATNPVTNSTINLGDGINIASTTSGTFSTDNTVIGGDQRDTFNLNEVESRFHGMDGDDVFNIDITNTATGSAFYKLNTLGGGVLLDGGHSNFRAFDILNGITGGPAGIGDTLNIAGNGSIDFSNVNDSFIKGIERLTLDATGNQTIILYASDVVQMTDDRNTLVIRADAGDTVDLEGLTRSGANVNIDDDAAGGPSDFQVWQGGGVTVLVEDQANII